jgi:hypothetical protein
MQNSFFARTLKIGDATRHLRWRGSDASDAAPLPRESGGEIGRHTGTFFAVNLLRRGLNHYADAVLRFTVDPAVPFTNNLGKRSMSCSR